MENYTDVLFVKVHITHNIWLHCLLTSDQCYVSQTTLHVTFLKHTTVLQFYRELYFAVLSEDIPEPLPSEMCIHTYLLTYSMEQSPS